MELPTKLKFSKELQFFEIVNFSNHRRMKHFIFKGSSCKKCGINCNRLIIAKSDQGHEHIDLYDESLQVFLTMGHIIPKSAGGALGKNIRPLCNKCNRKEGSGFEHVLEDRDLFDKYCLGAIVKRKNGNKFQNGKKSAAIIDIFRSKHDKKIYFVFEGGFTYEANKVIFTTHKVLTQKTITV